MLDILLYSTTDVKFPKLLSSVLTIFLTFCLFLWILKVLFVFLAILVTRLHAVYTRPRFICVVPKYQGGNFFSGGLSLS